MSEQPGVTPFRAASLRSEHSEATRQALVAAAREAFGAVGYRAAGIEAVARAARVSRGALYHHFRDKKALFDTVVVQAQSEAAAEIEAGARRKRDAWDQLVAGVAVYLEICQRPQYRRIVVEDAPAALGKARCAEIGDTYPMGVLRARLTELQASRRLTNVSATVLGALLGAMISEGAALLSAQAAKDDATADRVQAVLRTFLEAFRPAR